MRGDCDPDVSVWYKKKAYKIARIGQFNIIPDVTITIGEKVMDLGE